MKKASKSRYYFNIKLNSDRVSWYFEIYNHDYCVYYSKDDVSLHVPLKSRHFSSAINSNHPNWLKSSVLYQIFVDRFQSSDKDLRGLHSVSNRIKKKSWSEVPDSYNKSKCMDFYGGNLWGVIEKLPYLQDLGISTLYFNPIFEALTHHAYDCIDYSEVAKCFGGNDALIALSSKLNNLGMDYIIDISINHTGSKHQWLNDQNTREYYVKDPLGRYKTWEGASNLYTLDYSHDKLKDRMYRDDKSILKTWLGTPYNCRGFRFDVGHSLARDQSYFNHFTLWRDIRAALKSIESDCLILAEYWDDASNYLKGDVWDSVTNYYGFLIPIRKFLGLSLDARNKRKYLYNSNILIESFKSGLKEISFEQSLLQVNMLGTHDISRLYNHKEVDDNCYFYLSCLLLTYIGVPCLYYGDEILLAGSTKTNEGYRYPMNWDSNNFQSKYFYKLKTLIYLRREEQALQQGSIYFLEAPNGVISYFRKLGDKVFFIWLNFNEDCSDLTLNIPFLCDGDILSLRSVFDSNQTLKLTQTNHMIASDVTSGVYSN
ncbi:MAG: hypothetical protein KC646_04735 [Candidatus Cloacimonetes bacterium]|nr:hypothetical protein [Candidatus Cloacimonadota bacterium]